MFIGSVEHKAQEWQQIAQREIGQVHTDLVEAQGRLTAMESFVRDIQGQKQLEWWREFAAMVDQQLEQFEACLHEKIGNWTTLTIKTCQDMAGTVDDMQI